jgi:hypothetical protein
VSCDQDNLPCPSKYTFQSKTISPTRFSVGIPYICYKRSIFFSAGQKQTTRRSKLMCINSQTVGRDANTEPTFCGFCAYSALHCVFCASEPNYCVFCPYSAYLFILRIFSLPTIVMGILSLPTTISACLQPTCCIFCTSSAYFL